MLQFPSFAETVVIDGFFDDWSEPYAVSSDAVGDSIGPFDITTAEVKTEDTRVFVKFRFAQPCGLQNGPPSDVGLRLNMTAIGSEGRFTLDFREKSAIHSNNPEIRIPWSDLGYACLPTYASEEYELSFDTAAIGVKLGQSILLSFDGSDRLDTPLLIKTGPTQKSIRTLPVIAKDEADQFRVASFNTMFSGLCDPERQEAFCRLLKAVQSDIYCFVEETDQAGFHRAIQKLAPQDNHLNSIWRNGRCIATRHPLEPISNSDSDELCAAIVTTQTGERLIILVVHLECCGYENSPQDKIRIQQAKHIAQFISGLQSGHLLASCRNLPIIVVGDFNLVGSYEPLRILTHEGGLTEARVASLTGRSAITWRGLNDDLYAPGRLDYVTFDALRLQHAGGGIVNTEEMSQPLLRQLNLHPLDSRVSDHLLLFADFKVRSMPVISNSNRDNSSESRLSGQLQETTNK